MQRQESVSDSEEEDRALVEKTKEKEKKEKKKLVFEIKLSENANSQYEYNYKDMVRSSEHTLNTLWTHFEHTLNLPEDMPKIWQNLKNITYSLSNMDPRDASASKNKDWR